MAVDVDVIVEPDAADAPFGEDVGLDRQGLQRRPIEFLEQLAAGDAEPADRPLLVEADQQLADRLVELGQAVEAPVAQPPQQPALDDQHAGLDLGLVARLARPGRQDGGVVMRRHLGIGAVDLRLVEAGLDHRDLGVVGHDQTAARRRSPRRRGYGRRSSRPDLASRSPRHR